MLSKNRNRRGRPPKDPRMEKEKQKKILVTDEFPVPEDMDIDMKYVHVTYPDVREIKGKWTHAQHVAHRLLRTMGMPVREFCQKYEVGCEGTVSKKVAQGLAGIAPRRRSHTGVRHNQVVQVGREDIFPSVLDEVQENLLLLSEQVPGFHEIVVAVAKWKKVEQE